MRTDFPYQPLRQHAFQRGRNEKRLHAHVNQARYRARGIVCVQRAENLMAGERGADGDFGGFKIANFADHHDIRILPQNRAQASGKSEVTSGPNGNLRDAGQLVFNRVLNGEDF